MHSSFFIVRVHNSLYIGLKAEIGIETTTLATAMIPFRVIRTEESTDIGNQFLELTLCLPPGKVYL